MNHIHHPDYPSYVVYGDGTILREATGRVITPGARNGYLRVWMTNVAGKECRVAVHKIVLEAFTGPRPSTLHHGAHKNGNRQDNASDNLLWKLPVENEADKRAHGTAPKTRPPSKHESRARHPNTRAAIRRRAAAGESLTAIGLSLGMHRSAVSRIVRGLRYAPKRKRAA